MKLRQLKIAAGIIFACVLLGLFFYHLLGRPMRYEIPAGFKGWILVRFGDQNCEPLRSQGAFFVISVPPSGRFCTSNPKPQGLIYYRFAYVYPNGERETLRWNHHGKPEVQAWLIGYRLEDGSDEIFVGDE